MKHGTRVSDESSLETLAGYSRAARIGNIIAVSGTTARSRNGSVASPNETYCQTCECLERGIAAVEQLGGSRESVVRTRVLLTGEAEWEEAARAHKDVLGNVRPANSMYTVAGLIGDGFLVEVEMDAVVA